MGSGCHRAGSEFDWPRIGIIADRCCCEPIQPSRSGETGDDCHLSRMSPSQESLSFETHSDVLTSSPGENRTSPGPSFLLTRDFGFVWWSQLLSQVADGVSKLALLWFVYSITGSPLKTPSSASCKRFRLFSSVPSSAYWSIVSPKNRFSS